MALKAKFHYVSWFEAGRRQVRSQIPLCYLIRSWSATSFEPDSVMEFGANGTPEGVLHGIGRKLQIGLELAVAVVCHETFPST